MNPDPASRRQQHTAGERRNIAKAWIAQPEVIGAARDRLQSGKLRRW